MDNPTKSEIGYIINIATEMNVSQTKWDIVFHSQTDCKGKNRPTGCKVCEHDTEKCQIEFCALCQAKKGLPFDKNINYEYPDD
jgi:hypothetical protein